MNKTARRIRLIIILLIALSTCSCHEFDVPSLETESAVSPEDTSFAQDLVEQIKNIPPMSRSDVNFIIQHARSASRSIMFLDVDWSVTPKFLLPRFVEFSIEYHKKNDDAPILFHYVNCTALNNDYQPFKDIPGWQERGAILGGEGEIIWLENGRVIDVQTLIKFPTSAEFIEYTNEITSD